MKEFKRKIIGFLIIPLVLIVVCFLIPVPKIFNYHYIKGDCYNHGAWIYDRMARNITPIDIAFIGSSHTIHAFNEPLIEKEIEGLQVANFGYCRMGRNLQYVLLKYLLKYKKPRLVVIEIKEDETKESHDIFPNLADPSDLFLTKSLVNRDYFSDLYHGVVTRFEGVKQGYVFRKGYPEADMNNHGYGASDRIAPAEELTDNLNAWNKRLKRKPLKSWRNIQLNYPHAYLRAMIELLNEHRIPFCFMYLWEYGSNLELPMNYDYYKQIAPVLLPPKKLFVSPELWMDGTHLNDRGAEIISEWTAKELKGFVLPCDATTSR